MEYRIVRSKTLEDLEKDVNELILNAFPTAAAPKKTIKEAQLSLLLSMFAFCIKSVHGSPFQLAPKTIKP